MVHSQKTITNSAHCSCWATLIHWGENSCGAKIHGYLSQTFAKNIAEGVPKAPQAAEIHWNVPAQGL